MTRSKKVEKKQKEGNKQTIEEEELDQLHFLGMVVYKGEQKDKKQWIYNFKPKSSYLVKYTLLVIISNL